MAEERVNIKENVIELRTLTDEEIALNWAAGNKISYDSMEKLFKEGFTSMEALELIDSDDLARTKIPRGQQKLILANVGKLLNSKAHETGAQAQTSSSNVNDVTAEEPPTSITATRVTRSTHASTSASQSERTGNQITTIQDGSAQVEKGSSGDAFNTLLNSLQSGQRMASNGLVNTQDSLFSGVGLPPSENIPNNLLADKSVHSSQSWRDPQIFLESAASGKSAPTHYDITDFISNTVEEEIVVGGNGTQQVIVKSGPRKPKLENVTLAQWSVANLAILYKLVAESKLHAGNLLDYLSYTTKICQLVQRFTLISVLMYDREYRQLQARHDFRWVTDVPHFHTIHLQPRMTRSYQPAPGKPNGGVQRNTPPTSPMTLDGKVICKLYNSRNGCHYKDCRFVHQCSHSGCYQYHSAQNHSHSKN